MTNGSDPRTSEPVSEPDNTNLVALIESKKRLLAFEIAEAAKKQITTWATWIVGIAVVVGATLGIKTYIDVQTAIGNATAEQLSRAHNRSDKAIAEFERVREKELNDFRKQSREAVAQLERMLKSVQQTGTMTRNAILAIPQSLEVGAQQPRTVNRRGRQRPIGAGLSISSLSTSTRTSCCVVQDPSGSRFLLAADYAVDSVNNIVIQPGFSDGGTEHDAIGVVAQAVQFACLIEVNSDVDLYYDLPEIGRINGTAMPQLGETVRKFGSATGLTVGTVVEVEAIAQVAFPDGPKLIDCFAVQPEAAQFSAGGDGGAPVVNSSGQILGMVFAGSSGQSFCVPIEPILKELGVEIVSME